MHKDALTLEALLLLPAISHATRTSTSTTTTTTATATCIVPSSEENVDVHVSLVHLEVLHALPDDVVLHIFGVAQQAQARTCTGVRVGAHECARTRSPALFARFPAVLQQLLLALLRWAQ